LGAALPHCALTAGVVADKVDFVPQLSFLGALGWLCASSFLHSPFLSRLGNVQETSAVSFAPGGPPVSDLMAIVNFSPSAKGGSPGSGVSLVVTVVPAGTMIVLIPTTI
jgi:hypothetical protein